MSTLKERLSRLHKAVEPTAAPSGSDPQQREWERIGARIQKNDWGQFVIRVRRYPYDHVHGAYRLGDLCGGAEALAPLAAVGGKSGGGKGRRDHAGSRKTKEMGSDRTGRKETVPVRHDRLLFLDTETTGLGVGAGNVPFMVGIGYYETDAFVVEQLFIRNPAEEAAMLAHLGERLAMRDILVSYNGKCFDWPILKNRYILNRRREFADDPLHFDFLYPSRSLWRNTLPSCRLSSVERERLGLSRVDDVPGSLAPALYFQYLAEGDPAIIAGVFDHNETDVLTLACLAVHFSRLLKGNVPFDQLEAEELYRLALWFDKLGMNRLADDAFARLLERDPKETENYLLHAADYYKKQGRYAEAVPLWERAVALKRDAKIAAVEPFVELAIYYEHRMKDYELALRYAEMALEKAWGLMSASRFDGKRSALCEALRHRIERLQRKRDGFFGSLSGTVTGGTKRGARRDANGTIGAWQSTLL